MINFKHHLRNMALSVHLFHEWAYAFWKEKESGVTFKKPLNSQERTLFVEFYSFLRGGDLVAYDIGANLGTFSGCLAKMPNVSQIHAFEPINSVYGKLRDKMKAFPQVICHNVALGEINDELEMFVLDNKLPSSSLLRMQQSHKDEFPGNYQSHPENVIVVRLDDFVLQEGLPQPHIIKIDVQGYEDRVLRGGENIIRQANYCLLEMNFVPLYESAPLFEDIYQLMREMGFRLVGLSSALKGKSGRPVQIDGIFANDDLTGTS